MAYEASEIWIRLTFKMKTPDGEEYEDTHDAKLNKTVLARYQEDLGEYVQDAVHDLTDEEMKDILHEEYSETDTVLSVSAELKEFVGLRM